MKIRGDSRESQQIKCELRGITIIQIGLNWKCKYPSICRYECTN